MKRILLILALIFTIGCEKEWSHYYSMTGEFSIDTPDIARESVKFADMAIGPVTVNNISYSANNNKNPYVYAVSFYELSETVLKESTDVIMALAAKGFIDFTSKNPRSVIKREVTAGSVKGIELDVESSTGSKMARGRIYFAKDKVYYVVVEKVGDKTINEADRKFLDSFTFHFKDNN